jgi:hypothetical protein
MSIPLRTAYIGVETRYLAAPSLTVTRDNGRPNFLRTTPDKKPRTLCACQPVTAPISSIEAPPSWWSSASTLAALEVAFGDSGLRALEATGDELSIVETGFDALRLLARSRASVIVGTAGFAVAGDFTGTERLFAFGVVIGCSMVVRRTFRRLHHPKPAHQAGLRRMRRETALLAKPLPLRWRTQSSRIVHARWHALLTMFVGVISQPADSAEQRSKNFAVDSLKFGPPVRDCLVGTREDAAGSSRGYDLS